MKQQTKFFTFLMVMICSFCVSIVYAEVPISEEADTITDTIADNNHSSDQISANDSAKHEKSERKYKALEHSIAEVRAQLRLLDMQINSAKEETKDLHDRQKLYQDAVVRQRQDLAALIRMSYVLEHVNPIKVVFDQQNMTRLDRYLQYEKMLDQARYQTIQQIQSALQELQKTEAALQIKSQALQTQRKQLVAKKQILERLQKQ